MHYLDLSLKKIAIIVVMMTMLLISVAYTFSWKESTFGSTPFFHAAGLLWARTVSTISYSIERGTLLAALGFPTTFTANLSDDESAQAVPVLLYHRIVSPGNEINKGNLDESDGYNIPIDAFKDQMETLKRAGWQTITLDDFQKFLKGEKTLPKKSFLITFDDSTKDSFYPVDPILSALGYNAVEYVIVKDTNIEKSIYYLSPAEIHSMLATGRWEIGSHSNNAHVSYPIHENNDLGHFYSDLLWLPTEKRLETPEEFTARVYEDLKYSRDTIEHTYHISSNTMAFPFGDYGQDTKNFPQAASITLGEAQKVYDLIFSQTRGGLFTYNYPGKNSFHAVRIEPTPIWRGSDVLTAFTKGMPKELPYTDIFKNNLGWLHSWGDVTVEQGQLVLKAKNDTTGATALLDGSYTWNDYTFEATATWRRGYATLLADVQKEGTARACSFSAGNVRIQNRTDGTTTLLAELKDKNITAGEHRLGIRTIGTIISCLYDGEVVLTAEAADSSGGIGAEAWSEDAGLAAVTLGTVSVTQ